MEESSWLRCVLLLKGSPSSQPPPATVVLLQMSVSHPLFMGHWWEVKVCTAGRGRVHAGRVHAARAVVRNSCSARNEDLEIQGFQFYDKAKRAVHALRRITSLCKRESDDGREPISHTHGVTSCSTKSNSGLHCGEGTALLVLLLYV